MLTAVECFSRFSQTITSTPSHPKSHEAILRSRRSKDIEAWFVHSKISNFAMPTFLRLPDDRQKSWRTVRQKKTSELLDVVFTSTNRFRASEESEACLESKIASIRDETHTFEPVSSAFLRGSELQSVSFQINQRSPEAA